MTLTKLGKTVPTLGPPDLFFLQAAEGWFELGNLDEANNELEQISSRKRTHPDVLRLRWRIQARSRRWDCCLVIGRALTEGYPSDPRSWITLAETFYLLGEVQKAYRIATANVADFPYCWQLLHDAACYACLVGKFDEARLYFQQAISLGEPKAICPRAIDDPQFKAAWNDLNRRPKRRASSGHGT
jgi:tetratricopeptide (TPR) repeat protein